MLYEDDELMTLAMTRIGRMTRAVAPSGPSVGPRAKTEAKKLGLRPMEHPVAPALLFQNSSSRHFDLQAIFVIYHKICVT